MGTYVDPLTLDIDPLTMQRQNMKETLDLLSIQDDSLLVDVPQFWRSVATAMGIEPNGNDVVANAKLILGGLTDWDDDYVTADRKNLSPMAYGELLQRALKRKEILKA